MRTESSALLLSAGAALLIGGVGVAAAMATNSRAILLDGLFNLCFFVTALFALRVAHLLKRPDDACYPYGYLYFEPLINTVKGLLILGISLFARVDAAATSSPAGARSPSARRSATLPSPPSPAAWSCSPSAGAGAMSRAR
jgi:predicted Co/Zn/Cd cation transporter (cation efflux family)